MNEKELIELIKESLLSEEAPPLTDAEAEVFLSLPMQDSPVNLKRMRKRLAERVLIARHQEPVRRIEQKITFGTWIRRARNAARLSHDVIATAIGKDSLFIESVENEEALPWMLTPSAMAGMVILFRLHIDAVRQLLSYSYVADKERRQRFSYPHLSAPSSEVRAGLMFPGGYSSREDDEEPNKSTKSDHLEMDEEVVRFLSKLRKILERRQATDLL